MTTAHMAAWKMKHIASGVWRRFALSPKSKNHKQRWCRCALNVTAMLCSRLYLFHIASLSDAMNALSMNVRFSESSEFHRSAARLASLALSSMPVYSPQWR